MKPVYRHLLSKSLIERSPKRGLGIADAVTLNHTAGMTTRRRTKRHAKPKVWLVVIALVAALLLIGDDYPQLRQVVDAYLQEFVSDKRVVKRQVGNAEVIDGDTIDVTGSRVRLYGIDAPEAAQTCQRDGRTWVCGMIAKNSLVSLIAGRQVKCEEQDIDRYERRVATCWAEEENINAWMVENGWAVAYRQYGGAIYDQEEAVARAARRGIWSSEFVMPWDWRKSRR